MKKANDWFLWSGGKTFTPFASRKIIFQRENLNYLIVCFTQCFFNTLVIHTVGNCASLLQGFWEHKSGIKYPPTKAFFLACFLHTLDELLAWQIFTSLGLSVFTGIACQLQIWIKTSNLENSISPTPKKWVLVKLYLSFQFSSVCLQTCSSTLPIWRPTYNLWNKIFIFKLKLRHICNEDTLRLCPFDVHKVWLKMQISILGLLIGSLSNDDGSSKENGIKAISLDQ